MTQAQLIPFQTTYTVKKNIYTFLVSLAYLTNQMRVSFKVHTHFEGIRV